MGAFSFQAFASTGGSEALSVSAAWIEGETLHIEVTDTETKDSQTIEIDIRDLAAVREIITIQAADFDGNKSNVIEIKNPNYKPDEAPSETEKPQDDADKDDKNSKNPFTPDGTGSVIDNATGKDEKEFFTIKTDKDNTFYLVVDRQRNADNVYLLNAVTEGDLMALAEKGEGGGIPVPSPSPVEPTPTPAPQPDPEPPKETKSNGNGGIFIIIIIVLVVGGAGYYFKIYKPKQDLMNSEPDIDSDEDDDFFDDESFFLDDDELGDFEDADGLLDDETITEKGGDEA